MLTVAEFKGFKADKVTPKDLYVTVPLGIELEAHVRSAKAALKAIRESAPYIKALKDIEDVKELAVRAIHNAYDIEPGAELIVSDRYTDTLTFTVLQTSAKKKKEAAASRFSFTVK
jgi:hypothetical protein